MKYLSIFNTVLLFSGCQSPAPENASSDELSYLFNAYNEYLYYSWPEWATYNGVHTYNDRINDQSLQYEDQYMDSMQGFLNALLAIDKELVADDQLLNYKLFEYKLEDALEGYEFDISAYLEFSQQNGYHITFPQMVEFQPFKTEEDVLNYFKRLEAFPEQVNNILDRLRRGKDK